MDFMRDYLDNPRLQYERIHELNESLMFQLSSSVPCALFVAPDHSRRLRMPETGWARLTYSTSNSDTVHEEIALEAALWLASRRPNYAVLSGHHYWLLKQNNTEHHQLDTAMVDLAFRLWDICHSQPTQLLQSSALAVLCLQQVQLTFQ